MQVNYGKNWFFSLCQILNESDQFLIQFLKFSIKKYFVINCVLYKENLKVFITYQLRLPIFGLVVRAITPYK